jgi:hypothetical protein
VLFAGNNTSGFVTNDGGNILVTSYLWVGNAANVVGAVYLRNGGILNVGGNIGLGTINASTASGGKGYVYVQDGGILNLSNISPTNSIQPNSVLDISGSGVVTIPGDFAATMSAFTNAGKITASHIFIRLHFLACPGPYTFHIPDLTWKSGLFCHCSGLSMYTTRDRQRPRQGTDRHPLFELRPQRRQSVSRRFADVCVRIVLDQPIESSLDVVGVIVAQCPHGRDA